MAESDSRESPATNETHSVYGNKTRTGDTQELAAEPRRRPVLVILEGKGVGEQFVMQKDEVIIGRDMEVDFALKDGRVSRAHARIVWENFPKEDEDPLCRLEDLKSRNGTLLNGQRIQSHKITDGDRIIAGATLLGFYVKDERELSIDQRLLSMATTDSLTGLANRLFFESEARREIDRARRYERPLSMLVIDLDHFKQINDTHGHAAGDTVLRQFSRMLLVTVREGDVVGRLGGEEFAVLLPETSLAGALSSADRIRQRMEKHCFQHKDAKITATVSIGAVQYGTQYKSRADLFEAADRAMYQAKAAGRNRVCAALPEPANVEPDTDVGRKEVQAEK